MSNIQKYKNANPKEFQVPQNRIESEGDVLIKKLSAKQLNKTISLNKELLRENIFTKSTELTNITTYTAGENNFNTFKERAEFVDNLETLKNYGLTNEEIELYIDDQKGKNHLYIKHKNVCKEIVEDKLKYINSIIDSKKSAVISNNEKDNSVSRHIKELALNTKPESDETKLYKFALECSSTDKKSSTSNQDPINYLPELEKELFGHLEEKQIPEFKKRRKKRKKFFENNCTFSYDYNLKKSNWDVQDIDINVKRKPDSTYIYSNKVNISNKNNEIKQQDKKNIYGGRSFVGWEETSKTIDINKYEKITVQDIKTLQRFQNYQKGNPSKILFLKNLSRRTTEEDLVNLFSIFDNEDKKITYRLLTGKMTGQAFITFNSISKATSALDALNGLIINDKPIIIEYGKSCT